MPALAFQPIAWRYNHYGAPDWLTLAQAESVIRETINAWAACGKPMRYEGATISSPENNADGINTIGWRWTLGYLRNATTYIKPGQQDIVLSKEQIGQRGLVHLMRVLAHEMGHALGIHIHTQDTDSIMMAAFNPRSPVRPSAQDIALCRTS